MISKLEHALALAAEGYYVFPVKENAKTPLVPWTERSNRNPDTIKAWWMSELGSEHNYNIGIDCGKSGILVIDVDCKNNQPGKENYEKLAKTKGFGKDLYTVGTPSGGLHLYYRNSDFKSTASTLAMGIDTRGIGGYVLAAGSEIDGKFYSSAVSSLRPRDSLDDIPFWLSEALSSSKKKNTETPNGHKTIIEDNPDDIAYAIELLQNLEGATEDGTGDITTYKTFCKLKERGISLTTAIDLALEHWNPNCEPPWESEELKTKAENAYRYGQNATGVKSPLAEFDIPKEQPTEIKHTHNYAPGWMPKKANQIPRRQWVIPGIAQKGKVTLIVSEPGVGKSTLTLGTMLAKTSGKKLMGFDTGERGACAVFNNEDDVEEMERRLVAYMQHHVMSDTDLYNEAKSPLMFINSGEMKRLRIAKRLKDGTIAPDAVQALIAYVLENNIRLLIIDPFAETHPAQENSNEDIGTVAAMFRYVAQKGNCAVILIHHTKKPDKAIGQGGGGDMNLSRGASSLLGVARSVWTLTNMTEKEAATFSIPENDRHLYVVFEQAKANMAAPGGNKKYFKRVSVTLRLAPDDIDGESVGILEPIKLIANPGPAKADDIQFLHAMEEVLEVKNFTYTDMATAVIQLPEYSDKQHDAILKRIRRLLSEGIITGFKGVICVEETTIRGRKVKRIHLKKHSKLEASDII